MKDYLNAGRAGFSLMEVIIALGIVSLMLAGVTVFMVDTSRIMFTSEQKNIINSDIRLVTKMLWNDARDATYARIYDSFFSSGVRDVDTGNEHLRQSGESGNLLLLIDYEVDTNPADTISPPITRIVGYYLDEEAVSGDGIDSGWPIRRFVLPIDDDDQDLEVEELIPDASERVNHEIAIDLSKGIASGHLFYNFRDRSVMINAQITHGNQAKMITDTYNFTVTPRGPKGNDDPFSKYP